MPALFPYRRFVLDSPLPAEEVIKRMSLNVDRPRWLRLGRDHPPLQGTIVGNEFHLTRVIHYGNSFLPRVIGTVEAQPNGGSRLIGRMRLAYPTAIFMSFWFSFVVIIGIPLKLHPAPARSVQLGRPDTGVHVGSRCDDGAGWLPSGNSESPQGIARHSGIDRTGLDLNSFPISMQAQEAPPL